MANTSILGTYSPEDVVCIISNDNFVHTLSGFTDGTFLSITRVTPGSTLYTGADGTNARTIRDVRNLDITFTLHQSAESNDVLTQLFELDAAARNNSHLFNITIRDNTGRTLISSPTCFIGTSPDVDFATDISDRQWVLHSVGSKVNVGGNARLTQGAYDAITNLDGDVDSYWQPRSN